MSPATVDHEALAAAGPWIDTHCHLTIDDDHPADPTSADRASAGSAPDRGSQQQLDADSEVGPQARAGAHSPARAQQPATDHVSLVIDDARAHGVARLVTIATDAASSVAAIAIAAAHDPVWASVGLHPHDAKDGTGGLEALLDAPKVVAVGECGLDYHYEHSPRDDQRRAFAEQIDLAKRHDLALVIHTREAWDDTFAILDAEGIPDRTIIHCFTGGAAEAARCLDRGAYLSFSGIATFRNASDVRDAVGLCPLDRLLVETDSPFLAPVPYRGKPNRPEWVPVVGAAVAEVRGVEASVVAGAVWSNAAAVFRLP
jgi:TatD DNase family protein